MRKVPQTQLRCCPVCYKVWEFDRSQGRELGYPNFPTLGLRREVCFDCQKDKEN